ncbi:MAG: hypothetical protein AAF918_11345 [Pseudomonadota bacterium]
MRLGTLLGRRPIVRKALSHDESADDSAQAKMDASDVRSLGFWISNAFTIVATVLGVYLAASEGFKQALQFRQVEENEHTYDLLTALKSELEYNRTQAGETVEQGLKQLPQNWQEPPKRQSFVWQTMQAVPETFRVPPVALNGIALYYAQLDEHLTAAYDERKHPSDQRSAILALQEANATLDTTVLTAINTRMAELKAQLTHFGIDPDS